MKRNPKIQHFVAVSALLLAAQSTPAGAHASILRRALSLEKNFAYQEAAAAYEAGLKAASGKHVPKGIEERILRLTWLADSGRALEVRLRDLEICPVALHETCDRYHALLLLGRGPGALTAPEARSLRVNFASGISIQNRALWLMLAIENLKSLTPPQKLRFLETVGEGIPQVDPVIQSYFTQRIPDLVSKVMLELRGYERSKNGITPHNALGDLIEHRFRKIAEFERISDSLETLPWIRVREEIYRQLAGMYSDLIEDISAFRFPDSYRQGQLSAFRERSADILEASSDKEREYIEKWHAILARFTAAQDELLGNAFASPKLGRAPASVRREPLANSRSSLILLSRLFPDAGWNEGVSLPKEAPGIAARVRIGWSKNIEAGAWHRVTHVLREALQREILPEAEVLAMEALTLARAGSQSEALIRLASLRAKLPPSKAQILTTFIFNSYLDSLPDLQIQELLGENYK